MKVGLWKCVGTPPRFLYVLILGDLVGQVADRDGGEAVEGSESRRMSLQNNGDCKYFMACARKQL